MRSLKIWNNQVFYTKKKVANVLPTKSPHPTEMQQGLCPKRGSHLCVHIPNSHPMPSHVQGDASLYSVPVWQLWGLKNPYGCGMVWFTGSRHDGVQTLEPRPSTNTSQTLYLTKPRDLQLAICTSFNVLYR